MKNKSIVGLVLVVLAFFGAITFQMVTSKLALKIEPQANLANIQAALDRKLNIGWTRFSPQGGQNVIYVSASRGNDKNDGLSVDTPVKTLRRGQDLIRMNHGDWLVLRRGDEWNESFGTWTRSGTGKDNPTVISSYGTGPRPIINAKNNATGISTKTDGLSNFAIIGIHFRGFADDKHNNPGKGIQLSGKFSNLYFDDVKIEGFDTNIGSESCDNCGRKNIVLTHSIIANAYNKSGKGIGLFLSDVDGITIEDNVFYHNGWNNGNVTWDPNAPRTSPTMFSHAIYLSHHNGLNTVIRNNVVLESANAGIWLRRGGVVENNLLMRNTNGILSAMGPSTVKNNVIINGVNNIDSKLGATGIETKPVKPGTVYEGNIIAQSGNTSGAGFVAVSSYDFGDYNAGYTQADANETLAIMNGAFNYTFKNNIIYNAGIGFHISSPVKGIKGGDYINNQVTELRASPTYKYGPRGLCVNFENDAKHLTIKDNIFDCPKAEAPYYVNGQVLSFKEFVSRMSNLPNKNEHISYQYPDRNINSWMGSNNGYQAFVNGALNQSIDNWVAKYTAQGFNKYIRDGFSTLYGRKELILVSPNNKNGTPEFQPGAKLPLSYKITNLIDKAAVDLKATLDLQLYRSSGNNTPVLAVDKEFNIDAKDGTFNVEITLPQEAGTYGINSLLNISDGYSITTTGGDFMIKIASAINPPPPIPPPTNDSAKITMLWPNGGETITTGSTVTLKWKAENLSPDSLVRIALYKGGNLDRFITTSAPNSGTYTWTVPNLAAGSDYYFRITSQAKTSVSDESDKNFTIKQSVTPPPPPAPKPTPTTPSITVLSPNGGETMKVGDTVQIKWKPVNVSPSGTVRIGMWKGGQFQNYIVTDNDKVLNSGSYNWTIGERPAGNDYQIKISTSDGSLSDMSDGNFTVNPKPLPPGITVASPNGGETVTVGATYDVKWTTTSISATTPMKINVYKGGVFTNTITENAPNTGLYKWTVADRAAGSDYTIRVSVAADGTINDFSNGNFTVNVPPPPSPKITVSAPTAGENLKVGSTKTITWTGVGLGTSPAIRISLYKSGAYIKTLSSSEANDGSYSWIVGNETAGSDYSVRATWVGHDDVRGQSATFTISQ